MSQSTTWILQCFNCASEFEVTVPTSRAMTVDLQFFRCPHCSHRPLPHSPRHKVLRLKAPDTGYTPAVKHIDKSLQKSWGDSYYRAIIFPIGRKISLKGG